MGLKKVKAEVNAETLAFLEYCMKMKIGSFKFYLNRSFSASATKYLTSHFIDTVTITVGCYGHCDSLIRNLLDYSGGSRISQPEEALSQTAVPVYYLTIFSRNFREHASAVHFIFPNVQHFSCEIILRPRIIHWLPPPTVAPPDAYPSPTSLTPSDSHQNRYCW